MAATSPVNAQSSSEIKKEAKSAAKELVKDGWKLQGLGTIEGNMIRLMERQAKGEVLLVGATLNDFTNANAALANCRAQAIKEYMELYGDAALKGRVAEETSVLSDAQESNLVSMAEQLFEMQLKGELRLPALKLYKGSTSQGTYQMYCWWLLDEKKMASLREKAIKQACSDIDNAAKAGKKISNFVNGEDDDDD